MELADLFRCSFCGRSSRSVDRLIGGPGVFVCDRCVRACVGILERYETSGPGEAPATAELVPPWESMTDDEMLEALPHIAASTDRVRAHLDRWVEELRGRRITWARIGEALGTTRQSAWERLAKRSGRRSSGGARKR